MKTTKATLTVVQVPIRRNLYDFARSNFSHWLHPSLCLLLVISLNPFMTCVWCEIWLQVMMHKRMVIKDAVFFKQRNEFFACGPGWRCVTLWLFASELGYYFDGFCEDVSLL